MERIQFESIAIDGNSIEMRVKREHIDDSFLGSIGSNFGYDHTITGEVELLESDTVKLKIKRTAGKFWFAPKE